MHEVEEKILDPNLNELNEDNLSDHFTFHCVGEHIMKREIKRTLPDAASLSVAAE